MYYLLFTTTHCPRCPGFKDFIQKNVHFEGAVLDQNDSRFETLSKEFMVNSVPTFMVFEDKNLDGALLRTDDATEVYEFINRH